LKSWNAGMDGNNTSGNILTLKNLKADLLGAQGIVYALDGVDLAIRRGSIHGLVGESGSGKSVTAKAIMALLDKKHSRLSGSADFDGVELLSLPPRAMRSIRGKGISMIFQDPMSSLSPLKTIGSQIEGAIANHLNISAAERRARMRSLLERVGLIPAQARARQYPFELSGGMQQRVMIAQAVACEPKLLIADEPTTALDVTIQAQVLNLLKELQAETGMSVLLITHSFGVVAETCDQVSVMYAGQIVETAATAELLTAAAHPYSRALISCIPQPSPGRNGAALPVIPGGPPRLYSRPPGCPFAPRCAEAEERCKTAAPEPRVLGEDHVARCHHVPCRHASRDAVPLQGGADG
jgi:oligopeptide/dipeptide ABC transporter ATP-binding protein